MLAAPSRIWKGSSSPSRCLLQPDGESHETHFKRLSTRRFTCDGENLWPPLQWSGTPAGARSFVLLCDDPDAPAGTWHHWAAYDIPPTTTELADDAAQNTKMKQAVNDFRKVGYGGPCRTPGPEDKERRR
jgi:Raf kinase inhibitor-like YbhB/YbcL family protein